VRITTLDGSVLEVAAKDGFLSMQANVVTIVASTAEMVA